MKKYAPDMEQDKHSQLSILSEYIVDMAEKIKKKVKYVENLNTKSDIYMDEWNELHDLESRMEILLQIMKKITETKPR